MIKVSGIAVIFEQLENMDEQLVTEFPSVNPSWIVIKLEQSWNMDKQSVTELDICMISIIFFDA